MEEKYKMDPSAPTVAPPPYAPPSYEGAGGYPQQGFPPQPQPYPPTSYAQAPYPTAGYPPPPPPGADMSATGYPSYPPTTAAQPSVYPQGYAPVAQTQVVIQTQPGILSPGAPKPPNNLGLSIFACICCNACCLGLVALVLSLTSDSSYNNGDIEEARRKGESAKKVAVAAIVVSIIFCIIFFVVKFLALSACWPNCEDYRG